MQRMNESETVCTEAWLKSHQGISCALLMAAHSQLLFWSILEYWHFSLALEWQKVRLERQHHIWIIWGLRLWRTSQEDPSLYLMNLRFSFCLAWMFSIKLGLSLSDGEGSFHSTQRTGRRMVCHLLLFRLLNGVVNVFSALGMPQRLCYSILDLPVHPFVM